MLKIERTSMLADVLVKKQFESMSCLVMKFGGAAMACSDRFEKLATLIKKRLEIYSQIVVVVSAMGTTTDELMQLATDIHPNPPKREQDMLISVGERVSMALLAMALDLKGVDAISFTGSQSGIITTEEHSEAEILEVRPDRIVQALEEKKVVIVAGFQGVSLKKEITTLGRGGSDTSAVAIAAALNCEKVEFYKDVPGIGRTNPKTDPNTKIFPLLTYEKTLAIVGKGAEVLHHRCLLLAKKKGIALEIRPFYDPERVGTIIAPETAHVS
jgi:aspartate kinase